MARRALLIFINHDGGLGDEVDQVAEVHEGDDGGVIPLRFGGGPDGDEAEHGLLLGIGHRAHALRECGIAFHCGASSGAGTMRYRPLSFMFSSTRSRKAPSTMLSSSTRTTSEWQSAISAVSAWAIRCM